MRHYIGIDLDQFNIKAGIVDEAGVLVGKESIRMRVDRNRKANEIVRDIAYLAQNVIETSRVPWNAIHAMGIASPGMANNFNGILMQPVDLPLHHINMRNEIRKIVPLPVYIENNASCAVLAESLTGASRGTDHSVLLMIGKDIAGGVMVDRRIYHGLSLRRAEVPGRKAPRGAAGALGHFVIEMDGEPCRCGRNGCFAAYASTETLMRELVQAAKDSPKSMLNEMLQKNSDKTGIQMLFDAMREGDKAAKSIAGRYVRRLAVGLDNIASILMPEVIVLGGDICTEGEFVLSMIHEENDHSRPGFPEENRPRIAMSEAGDDAGMIGASMVAKYSLLDGIKGDGSPQGSLPNRRS